MNKPVTGNIRRGRLNEVPEGWAPVQGDTLCENRSDRRQAGMITWEEHLKVYAAYAKQYGTSQSAERLAERGGFGYDEAEKIMGEKLLTWRLR